ncbi:helix-turn-helix domain containing protein [Desulfovibrio sp. OttesenSCG-928-C14]|nr:helix-turn-helix domain containing protein [Desulfovibrio sp. OttesenSCG-928-C14]
MEIGDRIRQVRGTSARKRFSKSIEISENTLRNYEQKLSLPNSDIIARICIKYQLSANWLVLGEGPMQAGNVPASAELRAKHLLYEQKIADLEKQLSSAKDQAISAKDQALTAYAALADSRARELDLLMINGELKEKLAAFKNGREAEKSGDNRKIS